MSRLLDGLHTQHAFFYSPESSMKAPVSAQTNITEEDHFMMKGQAYRMTLTLGTIFYVANPALYDAARKNAEQRMAHALYKGALEQITQVKSAIYAGEYSLALAELDKLTRELIG